MRRTKEKAFYDAVIVDATAAKTIVDAGQGNTYDYPAAGTQGLVDIGLNSSAASAGPAKALLAAATNRDRGAAVTGPPALAAGSGKRLA